MNKHVTSILQALLVTFLWSTSFLIIKKVLPTIPPVTFAGLRYFLASLCLLPFAFRPSHRSEISKLNKRQWMKLLLLGLIFYVLTQGTQFLGLSLLPSTSVSLMLNFTPLVVIALSAALLNEKPSGRQLVGIVLFISGALVYFLPLSDIGSQVIGLTVMVLGVISNATSSVLGRNVNRKKDLCPFTITLISMSVGSLVLLQLGLVIEGVPNIPLKSWLSLIWLSGVNTAIAFTLWNRTLRHLTAMESSIINGTMLIQIAILAWVFLGENLSISNIGGMLIASVGAVLVQLRPRVDIERQDCLDYAEDAANNSY
ncbi:DMT family transporter [Marispirochaeta aestuarii]|uniref:DMT family transporter n=1 Tax=Marispirochaeta aestuarii TaxID=1963862 RepID=UPI002ABD189E|nr:DMT family transporter [Marispirochaeta aestuarii]